MRVILREWGWGPQVETPSESAHFCGDDGTDVGSGAQIDDCVVRPGWRHELARVCQVLAGESITAEPGLFLRAIENLARTLPPPSTRAEAGLLWDWLALQSMRAGLTHHAYYHRCIKDDGCAFSGASFRTDTDSTPALALSAWAARYAARFNEIHFIPPAIRAAHVLRIRYWEGWTMERLAVAARSSRSTLQRRFERVYGVSPHDFQTRLRLRQAAMSIREPDSKIDAVARSVGYASSKDMYSAFHRVLGCAPAEVRAMSQDVFDEFLSGPLRVMEAFDRRR